MHRLAATQTREVRRKPAKSMGEPHHKHEAGPILSGGRNIGGTSASDARRYSPLSCSLRDRIRKVRLLERYSRRKRSGRDTFLAYIDPNAPPVLSAPCLCGEFRSSEFGVWSSGFKVSGSHRAKTRWRRKRWRKPIGSSQRTPRQLEQIVDVNN
jgi:hypothetical protein